MTAPPCVYCESARTVLCGEIEPGQFHVECYGCGCAFVWSASSETGES